MFSKKLSIFVEKRLRERSKWLSAVMPELARVILDCNKDTALLLKYYYATMPLRDMGAYKAAVFLSYARHSMRLRNEVSWCKELPEDIFLHHVAYYRINSENIEPCREEFFYALYKKVANMSAEEAVITANYWCAEQACYAASDMRTASPVTVCRSGSGRCGEESTFTVSVLRSIGIPARQVYTPRWAHCDDNHAWVEVYVNGGWHFLGACEPEEALDRGWFTAAAARAMVIHSRVFGGYPVEGEQKIADDGLLSLYNSTSLYADTKELTIKGTMGGAPAAGAEVSLQIFNMAELSPIVKARLNGSGKLTVTVGKGELLAVITKNGEAAAGLIMPNDTKVSLTLKPQPLSEAIGGVLSGTIDFIAPPAVPGRGAKLSEEQKIKGRARFKEAARLREERLAPIRPKAGMPTGISFKLADGAMLPQEEAMALQEKTLTIIEEARGNVREICNFLLGEDLDFRLRLLKTLSKKDLLDVKANVLESHLKAAKAIAKNVRTGRDSGGKPVFGELPEELFDSLILCPRAFFEELTDYRRGLFNAFSKAERKEFTEEPTALAGWIASNITYSPEQSCEAVYMTPLGSMLLRDAGPDSKKILFVLACRSLGIPARLNPNTREAEFYENGAFVPAVEEERFKTATLALHTETPKDMVYRTSWGLAKLTEGEYTTLSYSGAAFSEAGDLELLLPLGDYRLITSSRMPNGNQKIDTAFFALNEGETKRITLALPEGLLTDYLMDIEFPPMVFTGREVKPFYAAERYMGEKRVLAFLEEGSEPTEHVLNELIEKSQNGGVKFAPILIVNSLSALENRTLKKAMEALGNYEICVADYDMYLEPLARHMFVDHEKLPLLLVTNEHFRGVYASSGYRVGSIDLIEKLLSAI